MANTLTVSYYGHDFKKIRVFLIAIARNLPIEWEFVYEGNPLDIIGENFVATNVIIYDVSTTSDSDCSRIFEFLLSTGVFGKSRVFANISGNKFAEKYCAVNHEVPYEIPFDEGTHYLIWYDMIRRLYS
jgi:hypothetical protein